MSRNRRHGDGMANDIAPRVREVIALVEARCDEMFDAEIRTACKRFNSRVAASRPRPTA
jgi:hypothetical protein